MGGGGAIAMALSSNPLPQGEGKYPLQVGHSYVSIRMRGSIIASAMSDNSVPTMVRNE